MTKQILDFWSHMVLLETTRGVAGGHADVAHKDLDTSPRKRVLQILPIQLSSATIDRERNSPTDDTAYPLKDKWPFSPPTLHLTASASRATPPEPQNSGHER